MKEGSRGGLLMAKSRRGRYPQMEGGKREKGNGKRSQIFTSVILMDLSREGKANLFEKNSQKKGPLRKAEKKKGWGKVRTRKERAGNQNYTAGEGVGKGQEIRKESIIAGRVLPKKKKKEQESSAIGLEQARHA